VVWENSEVLPRFFLHQHCSSRYCSDGLKAKWEFPCSGAPFFFSEKAGAPTRGGSFRSSIARLGILFRRIEGQIGVSVLSRAYNG
jgi:hypothetical protein